MSVLLRKAEPRVVLMSVPLRRSEPRVVLMSVPLRRSEPRVVLMSVPLRRSKPRVVLMSVPLRRSEPRVVLISVGIQGFDAVALPAAATSQEPPSILVYICAPIFKGGISYIVGYPYTYLYIVIRRPGTPPEAAFLLPTYL